MINQLEKNECYAIYDGITHKPVIGGLNTKGAAMVRELLAEQGELYAVINKRNGEAVERFMTKDDAIAFSRGYGGTIVVRENIYLAESRGKRRTALVGDTVVLAPLNRELAQKWKDYFVTGREHEKRSLGTFTNDTNEMNIIKGYMWNSVKSAILPRNPKQKRQKRSLPTHDQIFKAGYMYLRAHRKGWKHSGLIKALPAIGLSNRQKKEIANRIIVSAKFKYII